MSTTSGRASAARDALRVMVVGRKDNGASNALRKADVATAGGVVHRVFTRPPRTARGGRQVPPDMLMSA